MEALVPKFLGHIDPGDVGRARGIHVADKADIAAQRQPADLPARASAVGPPCDLAPEADREGLRADAEPAADEVMAELVEEDERPDRADERDQDEPQRRLLEHQWQRALISAAVASRV